MNAHGRKRKRNREPRNNGAEAMAAEVVKNSREERREEVQRVSKKNWGVL